MYTRITVVLFEYCNYWIWVYTKFIWTDYFLGTQFGLIQSSFTKYVCMWKLRYFLGQYSCNAVYLYFWWSCCLKILCLATKQNVQYCHLNLLMTKVIYFVWSWGNYRANIIYVHHPHSHIVSYYLAICNIYFTPTKPMSWNIQL